MKFRITTLVDITETSVRPNSRQDTKLEHQQANFMTVYQVIGLRTNPTEFVVEQHEDKVGSMKFGSRFKGEHRYWTCDFVVEAEQSLTLDMMIADFDLVPIITGLDETVKITDSVFRTQDSKDKNIVFEFIE